MKYHRGDIVSTSIGTGFVLGTIGNTVRVGYPVGKGLDCADFEVKSLDAEDRNIVRKASLQIKPLIDNDVLFDSFKEYMYGQP